MPKSEIHVNFPLCSYLAKTPIQNLLPPRGFFFWSLRTIKQQYSILLCILIILVEVSQVTIFLAALVTALNLVFKKYLKEDESLKMSTTYDSNPPPSWAMLRLINISSMHVMYLSDHHLPNASMDSCIMNSTRTYLSL